MTAAYKTPISPTYFGLQSVPQDTIKNTFYGVVSKFDDPFTVQYKYD